MLIIVIFVLAALACGDGPDSPIAAYRRLHAAVKAKDTEAIKKEMTKATIELGIVTSQRNNKPVEKAYENGMTATTFAAGLPDMRDERVRGEMGAVEVWNAADKVWEDLPFILQDGAWKLAIGDAFLGLYKSPGPGRDEREKEAANAARPQMPMPNSNSNTNKPLIIQPPNQPGPKTRP